jgi:hypothetical protein
MEKYGIMELISFHVHLHFKGPHAVSKSVRSWRNILDELLNVKLKPVATGVFDGFIGWAESLEWLTGSQTLKNLRSPLSYTMSWQIP